ncbi:MAG: hypothetical protein QG553_825 [Patescibacteria group bacterium]|nr:hypothetical protein [Patescibacteria group bacterium]
MKNSSNDPYITQSMLDQRLEEVSRKIIDDITEVIRDFSDRVDERFNRLEVKVDRLETKVDAMGFANQASDAQVTRHERWHYQVANKLELTFNPEI